MPTPSTDTDLATAAELGQQLRVDSIRSSTSAGSGHPTSSMSGADLMAVLVSRHLRYDWDNPDHPGNDHLIFSKGHASPLLYSIYKAVGVVSDEELMTGYRRFGSRLEGHPTPVLPWVDVATGSLGQGLPDGVGVALAGKYLDELPYRVWVLCGDSEMAEGSMWEAFDKASHYKLANLIAIVDINRLGQRGPTDLGWDMEAYRRRAEAFGARVFVIDGHDVAAIDQAMAEAGDLSGERPAVILARTIKGRGAPRWRTARTGTASRCRPRWPNGPSPSSAASVTCSSGARRPPTGSRGLAPTGPSRSSCRSTTAARRWPPARRTARRWPRSAPGPTWWRWTARSATRPSPTCSPRRIPGDSSRCTSPSSSWSPRRSASACAATGRSPRPSPRSSPGPTTSSGWPPSPGPASAWPARTPAWRSARTGRPRWRWRTWP